MPAIQCKLMNVCGLAESCCHARPHPGVRCGHCGTKCWDSNGFCNGGQCSQIRGGMDTETYIAMCREFGRPKCVESADVLPARSPPQHSGGA